MKNGLLILLFIVTSAAYSFGQPIQIGAKKSIQSKVLGEERTYYIYTPDSYGLSDENYPVLYVLDGHEYFWMAASAVRYFSNRGLMPATIVVGIDNSQNRDRDLTPSPDQYTPNGGGADNFHLFLVEELMPEIERNYPLLPHKTVYGASLGGLFSMYVLFNYEDTFDNYLAISPSLFHDDAMVFDLGVKYMTLNDSASKYVFMSLADEAWTEMRVSFNNTVALFKDYADQKGVRWDYAFYNNETHGSTKLVGLNDGLRKLHGSWFTPFYQRDRGIAGIKDHYKKLSIQYGFEIEVPQGLVNRAGYNLLRENKLEAALSCFSYNTEAFPDSPNAFDSLGDYYFKVKAFDKAVANYKQAVNLAEKQGMDTSYFKNNLEKAESALLK